MLKVALAVLPMERGSRPGQGERSLSGPIFLAPRAKLAHCTPPTAYYRQSPGSAANFALGLLGLPIGQKDQSGMPRPCKNECARIDISLSTWRLDLVGVSRCIENIVDCSFITLSLVRESQPILYQYKRGKKETGFYLCRYDERSKVIRVVVVVVVVATFFWHSHFWEDFSKQGSNTGLCSYTYLVMSVFESWFTVCICSWVCWNSW